MLPDRAAGGRLLAKEVERKLPDARDSRDVIVLALPRGGVPVAYEVARALRAPLDVFVVRKLGVPHQPEFAFGAIASGGVIVLDEDLVRALRIPPAQLEAVVERERIELARRERAYRGDRAQPEVRGKTVILVDDGLATGASMQAALTALRAREPGRLVAAVPVGAARSCEALRAAADDVVCATTPEPFGAVGSWYDDFEPTSDADVHALLERATRDAAAHGAERASPALEQ
jgi:putative phosphoribosyl transferase